MWLLPVQKTWASMTFCFYNSKMASEYKYFLKELYLLNANQEKWINIGAFKFF